MTDTKVAKADARETAQTLAEIYRKRRENPRRIWGIPYGRPALDAATGGIQTEPTNDFTFLFSRPSVGKTSLTADLVKNVATWFREIEQSEKVVRCILLEGGRHSFQTRMACMLAGVKHRDLKTGFISDADYAKFAAAMREIFKLPIEYLDGTTEQVSMSRIEDFVGQDDTGWWVLDHIGCIPGARRGHEALSEISGQLAQLCKATAPALILTHQNRTASGPKDEKDQRPSMENLAGADFVVRDADVLLGLYRPDKDKSVKNPSQATGIKPGELIIVKNRDGDEGVIHMYYHGGYTRWEDNDSANQYWLNMLEQ